MQYSSKHTIDTQNSGRDITRMLISNQYLYNNISALFPDSIILNNNFKIVSVTFSVLHSLGYLHEEIYDKSISVIETTGGLENTLKLELDKGYFSDKEFKILKKSSGSINYSISGFYLGLISDLSDLIILRFNNLEEVKELENKNKKARAQFDKFVYRAAHDLRGPLATIEGLVHLLKMRKDDSEIDRFIQMIDLHAKKLDERLFQLVYVSDTEDEDQPDVKYYLNFSEVESHLRRVIERNAFIDFMELTFTAPKEPIYGINENQIQSLLTDILLHLLSLVKQETDSSVNFFVDNTTTGLSILIKAEGFVVDNEIKKILKDKNFSLYTDLMRNPRLTHLYAALKTVEKLNAIMGVDVLSDSSQQFSLVVPFHLKVY